VSFSIKRRSFLKSVIGSIIAIITGIPCKPQKALDFAPMVEPIRRSLEYQRIGRKLLMVEELPEGAYARYRKDIRAI